MNISKPNIKLIFTDLDGTFLSAKNFSHGDNIELVNKITNSGNFVIFNSSKTFIEIKNFLFQNNLKIPFICENGGGIYTPKNFFPSGIYNSKDAYDVISEFPQISSDVDKLKDLLPDEFLKNIIFFRSLSIDEKMYYSGLSESDLNFAEKRVHTELVIWKSDNVQLSRFANFLESVDLTISKGGRFYHISHSHNKLQAMNILVNEFKKYYSNNSYTTIALGDSYNDIDMLNNVDIACLIKNENNSDLLEKITSPILIKSQLIAPDAWKECIDKLNILY